MIIYHIFHLLNKSIFFDILNDIIDFYCKYSQKIIFYSPIYNYKLKTLPKYIFYEYIQYNNKLKKIMYSNL